MSVCGMVGDAMRKFWALVLVAGIYGCGQQTFTKINNTPEVQFARTYAEMYFDMKIDTTVYLTDPEMIKVSCLNSQAAGCYRLEIITISGPSPYEICWQAIHEFGHAAEFRADGQADKSHEKNKLFYEQIVFETCSNFI